MAIQNRRGSFADFRANKLVEGEWAVVTSGDPNTESGQAIYICFEPGVVKMMATYEDMVENINNATEDIQAMFTADMQTAILEATQATAEANTVISNAEQAISRANDAADNAEDVYERLKDVDVTALEQRIDDLATVAETGKAEDVTYDNETSKLVATDVQNAINEVSARVAEKTTINKNNWVIPIAAIAAGGTIQIQTDIPAGKHVLPATIYAGGSPHSLIFAGYSGGTSGIVINIRNVGTASITPTSTWRVYGYWI